MVLFVLNTLCVLFAIVTSATAILGHLKNYRKPIDQRLIIRILVMVPLFGLSAWLNLYSSHAVIAGLCEFVRELYEPFVIYTFYSLLVNLLGGEREIIYNATGRAPVRYFWMRIDISDPYVFWVVKRLIMQYVWVRPCVTLLMYPVSPHKRLLVCLIVAYNVSVTLALNALMAFWVCLRTDLQPYRVLLKFFSVKLIVFFSYWQSLGLSILHGLGWISEGSLVFWKNGLICWESVGFAVVHWLAFPPSDYYSTFMFGFARLRIDAALRDALGCADLVHDFRRTFLESRYSVKDFDSVEAVLDHPDSRTRQNRLAAGLRYRNQGRSKYWLPSSSLQRLLHEEVSGRGYGATGVHDSSAPVAPEFDERSRASRDGPSDGSTPEARELNMEDEHSEGEEELYRAARKVYGDYNYPVATVRESEEYVSFSEWQNRRRILESV